MVGEPTVNVLEIGITVSYNNSKLPVVLLLRSVSIFTVGVLETQPYPVELTLTQGTSGGQEGQITS